MAATQDQAVMSLVLEGKNDAKVALDQFNSQIRESLGWVRQLRGSMLLIGAAVGGFVYTMSKLVSAYDKQRIQANQLRFAFNLQGISYDNVRNSLEAYLASMEYKTGGSDERLMKGMIEASRVTDDYAMILSLATGATDLAAATGVTYEEAVKLLTEAYKGNLEGLSKLGFKMDDTKTSGENIAAVLDKVKGAAKENQTEVSKLSTNWSQLSSTLSETVGPALASVIGWINTALVWKGWNISDEDIKNAIIRPFQLAWNWLKTEFSWSGLMDNFSLEFGGPIDTALWGIAGTFLTVFNWLKTPLDAAWKGLKDVFGEVFKNPVELLLWGTAGQFLSIWNWLKDEAQKIWNDMVAIARNVWQGNFVNVFKGGINLIIDALNALGNAMESVLSIEVPSWIPGVGGKGWNVNVPDIPRLSYQYGGTVPGPIGEPVPIMAHGGERYLGAMGGAGGTGPIIINLDGREIARYTIDILSREAKLQRAW